MGSKALSELKKRVIEVLQEDFPLCEEPFKVLAKRAAVSEECFLNYVRKLIAEKKIRRLGIIVGHRKAGFKANALVIWRVNPEQVAGFVKIVDSYELISHCYSRFPAPNWDYNFYTMIHTKTREECERIINEISKITKAKDFKIFYTLKEWKKKEMKYFNK